MAEWRECELRHDERTTRFGRVKADCNLGIGDEQGLSPSICAECPVPDDRRDAKKWRECGAALVKAVDKARIHCGWLMSEFQEGGKPSDLVESTRYVYDLCTAALEQAKGEEHDG